MKVCVFGPGAIGGHLAARLAKGGAEVSVVARGPHLDAIRRDGLTVRTPQGPLHAKVTASDDPAALGAQDAVLVTVKAPALPSVAQRIAPLLKPETPVVFVMNGIPWWYFHAHGGPLDGTRLPRIDPGGALWNAIGPHRAVGGVVNAPSAVVEPGVVNVERESNYLILGEPDGSSSQRAEALARLMRDPHFDVKVTDDIRTAIWDKLISNLMAGPMCVLTQSGYRDFLMEPACMDAARRIVLETAAVAQALGCKPDLDHETRLARSSKLAHRASILQDLELGRPMEVDAIFAMPVELARLVNVPTPTLDLLVGLAKARARRAGLYDESKEDRPVMPAKAGTQ